MTDVNVVSKVRGTEERCDAWTHAKMECMEDGKGERKCERCAFSTLLRTAPRLCLNGLWTNRRTLSATNGKNKSKYLPRSLPALSCNMANNLLYIVAHHLFFSIQGAIYASVGEVDSYNANGKSAWAPQQDAPRPTYVLSPTRPPLLSVDRSSPQFHVSSLHPCPGT